HFTIIIYFVFIVFRQCFFEVSINFALNMNIFSVFCNFIFANLSYRTYMESQRKELTNRQSVVLEFLKQYINNNGIAPTVAEICRNFKLKSTNAAHQHLVALERKGYIDRGGKGQSRYIKIIDNAPIQNSMNNNNSSKLLKIKVIEKGDGINPF